MQKLLGTIVFVAFLILPSCSSKGTSDVTEVAESIDTVIAEVPEVKNYVGTYSFGTHPDSGATGTIQLYPLNDTSLLFYLDVNRGAPSYNMGAMLGEVQIKDGRAMYSFKEGDYIDCKLNFIFSGDTLSLVSTDGQSDCGFGYGVYADGNYVLKSHELPRFFLTGEGDTIFFEGLTLEKYNKR